MEFPANMTRSTTITLPLERHIQLKEIAEAFGGLSLAETIGEMIRELAYAGTIRLSVPGIEVVGVADGVVIRFEGGEPIGFTFDQAAALSADIKRYAEVDEKLPMHVDFDSNFIVARKARSVKLTIPATNGTEKTLSFDLARDLAEVIDRAARREA